MIRRKSGRKLDSAHREAAEKVASLNLRQSRMEPLEIRFIKAAAKGVR